jgi:hypothetical protein
MMSAVFRGKMMEALRRLHRRGDLAAFDELRDPQAFEQLMTRAARAPWVVYAKKPFHRPDHVLRYLGRYTHRVAISNSRIVSVTDDEVTFRTKEGKRATLRPVEFLRRFLQHVLPPGFHKIRHFGLYAGAAVTESLAAAREALVPVPGSAPPSPVMPSWPERLRTLTGRDVDRCRVCGGVVEHVPLPRPDLPARSRAPPGRVA